MNIQGHINTFSGGMDKDTAPSKYTNLKYEHAENLRLLTDDGLTTGAMINIAGTEKLLDLPNIVRFTRKLRDDGSVYTGDNNLFLTFRTPSGDLGVSTINVNDANNNGQLASEQTAYEFVEKFNAEVIFSGFLTAHLLGETNALGYPSQAVVTSNSSAYNILNTNGLTTGETGGFLFEVISDYKILGSTTLRDSIIVFTTDNESITGGEGQIWKIDYDDSTLEPTTELIFAGDMSFSTNYLIEAVGRYETSNIQRIYWTDNFNTVRSINIADPKRFQTKVDLLALSAEVTLVPGKFTQIGAKNSGQLDVGTYTVSYRLQTRSGITTNIAPWSVPISVNSADESLEHWNYQRGDHNAGFLAANKSLTFTIDEFDDGYDYIEIFLLKRGISEGVLYKVDTATISSLANFEFIITGAEGEFTEIFKDEIENFNIVFDTVKTINIKDNRLLLGNIKETSQLIEYDATAYRYRQATTGNVPTHSSANGFIDGINPYNKDSTRDNYNGKAYSNHDSRDHFKFRGTSPSYLTPTILGGGDVDGNISYTFTTHSIDLDDKRPDVVSNYNTFPMIDFKKGTYSKIINGIKYNAGGLWNNYKNPYIEYLLAGYQRSEVYRFGILFYDLYSKPLDVKWIGDIRMPEIYDEGFNTIESVAGELKGKILGLNFDVDISSIKEKISGFSIVRAPRPNKDRTILGQGKVGDIAKVNLSKYWIDPSFPYSQKYVDDNSSIEGVYNHFNNQREQNDIGQIRNFTYGYNTRLATDDLTISSDQGPDLWIGNYENPVFMAIDRVGEIDSIRLQHTSKYDRVITFDSPQMVNGYGEPRLYGNIIGGEAQGLQGFSDVKLKPICMTSTSTADRTDEVGPVKFGDWLFERNNTTAIFYYISKQYDYRYLFTNNSQGLAPSDVNNLDPIDNVLKVSGAIRMNNYNDNFLLNNYTKTDLLNIINSGGQGDPDFYAIDTNTRSNSNSDRLLIGLDKAITQWYKKWGDLREPSTNYGEPWVNGAVVGNHYLTKIKGMYKLIANLYSENPGQYGGQTALDRDRTTYISTGHYQKVTKDGPDKFSCEVFGGDTFINLISQVTNYPCPRVNDPATNKQYSDLDGALKGYLAANTRQYNIEAYPLESTINMDMIYEKSPTDYTTYREKEDRATNEEYDIINTSGQPTEKLYPFAVDDVTANFRILEEKDQLLLNRAVDNTYKARLGADIGNFQAEDYSSTSFSLSSLSILTDEFDNRVYASSAKVNGDRRDAWSSFKVNNSINVDGHYGPINKLEVLNNNVIFFQDRGFGVIAVNPRSLITDASGAQLELGTGDVLHDFDYVSTEIGSKHQKSIIKSREGVYFFDANSRKFYRFRGKSEPLSDMKGMSSWFYNNITGDILNEDNILAGAGFATGFDPRYNEILFTFRDSSSAEDIVQEGNGTASYDAGFTKATIVLDSSNFVAAFQSTLLMAAIFNPTIPGILETATTRVYYSIYGDPYKEIFNYEKVGDYKFTIPFTEGFRGGGGDIKIKLVKSVRLYNKETATIVYSEAIDAFAGFYSFTPTHYIMDGARLFSPDPSNPSQIYTHNEGERCTFYDNAPVPSIIRIIANPKGMNAKIFNNVEYLSQLQDTNGDDILNETFSIFKVYNEYQSSTKDLISYGTALTSIDQMHVRRRMRNWRLQIPRSGTEKARIRNPYTTMEFTYNNNDNKKITLNDIITYYMDVPM